MFLELHAIERPCYEASPALRLIVLIDPDDLVSQPSYFVVPNLEALEFKPGKSAYAFHHEAFTGRLTDKVVKNNPAGDFFEYDLKATVRTVRPTVESLRLKLMNRRIHVVATYGDRFQRFVPMLRMNGDSDSGDRNSPNLYAFSGFTQVTQPAPSLGVELGGEDPTEEVNIYEVLRLSGSTTPTTAPAGSGDPHIAVNDAGKIWVWSSLISIWIFIGKPVRHSHIIPNAEGNEFELPIPTPSNVDLDFEVYCDGIRMINNEDFELSGSTYQTLYFYIPRLGQRVLIFSTIY